MLNTFSGATPESCYSMRGVSEGTANRTEAAIYCGEEFQSTLPTPKTMEEIAAINGYVIGQGVPRNSIPGYPHPSDTKLEMTR